MYRYPYLFGKLASLTQRFRVLRKDVVPLSRKTLLLVHGNGTFSTGHSTETKSSYALNYFFYERMVKLLQEELFSLKSVKMLDGN